MTQPTDRESAEERIFSLRKKISMYLLAGDTAEVARLQLKISDLQKQYGAVSGTRRTINDRGNDTGPEPGN